MSLIPLSMLMLAVAAVALVLFFQARKLEKAAERLEGPAPVGLLENKNAERSVTNLHLGDIVTHFGVDYVVEGRIDYNDSGWPWTCYMLVDGDNVRWLAVEMDDTLEVSIWEEIDMTLPANPPSVIEYEGQRFKMVENGRATATQTGQTGRRAGLSVEYFEYESGGDRYLSVEKWGMETEVSVGQDINPYSLEILPGGGSSFA